MDQQLWDEVDAYFESRLIGADPALESALEASSAAGLPDIQVTACQGKLLNLLALAIAARRILEIGTLGGYSTIWLARALPADGTLVTLELEHAHAVLARENCRRAGLAGRVEVREGAALATLAALRAARAEPFDLIFVDADKAGIPAYLEHSLALSRAGSLIVVDNYVRRGQIVRDPQDASAEGVRRATEWIAREPRLSATAIQTVGRKGHDGFLLARVRGAA